jgi:7-carboxy-7-deazaguanine synthase
MFQLKIKLFMLQYISNSLRIAIFFNQSIEQNMAINLRLRLAPSYAHKLGVVLFNLGKYGVNTDIEKLELKDQLKFVIGSKADFDWSVALLSKHPTPAEVLFSPVFEAVEPMQLAQWP